MIHQTAKDWHAAAKALSFRTHGIIDGKAVQAVSGETFQTSSPIDGRPLGHLPQMGAADVDKAVASARAAFEDGRWSARAPSDRKAILLHTTAKLAHGRYDRQSGRFPAHAGPSCSKELHFTRGDRRNFTEPWSYRCAHDAAQLWSDQS